MSPDEILDRLANLNTAVTGSTRYPHKPLLVLLAIKHALDGDDFVTFEMVRDKLSRLLNVFAPPVVTQNVANPYWRLMKDEIWQVQGVPASYFDHSTPPGISVLNPSHGQLVPDFSEKLRSDPAFRDRAIDTVLSCYFPETLHEDLLGAIGLEFTPESVTYTTQKELSRARDPYFRARVLAAYDYRCAVTGFQAALGGTYFGCEAAHVKWHAYEGPDSVENGISLEPTMHKLLDVGAWTLTDDRRVLVSADFTGSDYAIEKLRGMHGKPIAQPAPGNPEIDERYIRWHRERDLGGIFRGPGLPL